MQLLYIQKIELMYGVVLKNGESTAVAASKISGVPLEKICA